MKSTKRIALVLVMALMLCSVVKTEVMAKEYKQSITRTDGTTFKKAWQIKTELFPDIEGYDELGAMITYGYDTWWTKEDYVKSVGGVPTGFGAYGFIWNSKCNFTEKQTPRVGDAKLTGKVDVPHKNSEVVKYGVCIFTKE